MSSRSLGWWSLDQAAAPNKEGPPLPLNRARRELTAAITEIRRLDDENQQLKTEIARLEHALSTEEIMAARTAEVTLPGNPWHEALAAREMEVLMRLMEGDTSVQIAAKLFISESTVKAHIAAIFTKLHVHSRAAAVTAAGRLGIKPEDPPEEDHP